MAKRRISYRVKQARKARLQVAGLIVGMIVGMPVIMLLATCYGATLANDTTIVPAIFKALGVL